MLLRFGNTFFQLCFAYLSLGLATTTGTVDRLAPMGH